MTLFFVNRTNVYAEIKTRILYPDENENLKEINTPFVSRFLYGDRMSPSEVNAANAFPNIRFRNYAEKDMLIVDSPPFIGEYQHISDIAAKCELPIYFYYDHSGMNTAKNSINLVRYYLDRNEYNLIREDQLVKSVAASLNNIAKVKKMSGDYVEFLDNDYMQVVISSTDVKIRSEGWKVDIYNNMTVISRFGNADKLELLLQ